MADACLGIGIRLTREYDKTGTKHDRDIPTNHGWKIVLSRGLDVFRHFDLNDAFSFVNRMQQDRQCKAFNLTCVKVWPTAKKSGVVTGQAGQSQQFCILA